MTYNAPITIIEPIAKIGIKEVMAMRPLNLPENIMTNPLKI